MTSNHNAIRNTRHVYVDMSIRVDGEHEHNTMWALAADESTTFEHHDELHDVISELIGNVHAVIHNGVTTRFNPSPVTLEGPLESADV